MVPNERGSLSPLSRKTIMLDQYDIHLVSLIDRHIARIHACATDEAVKVFCRACTRFIRKVASHTILGDGEQPALDGKRMRLSRKQREALARSVYRHRSPYRSTSCCNALRSGARPRRTITHSAVSVRQRYHDGFPESRRDGLPITRALSRIRSARRLAHACRRELRLRQASCSVAPWHENGGGPRRTSARRDPAATVPGRDR